MYEAMNIGRFCGLILGIPAWLFPEPLHVLSSLKMWGRTTTELTHQAEGSDERPTNKNAGMKAGVLVFT